MKSTIALLAATAAVLLQGCLLTATFEQTDQAGHVTSIGVSHDFTPKPKPKMRADAKQVKPLE